LLLLLVNGILFLAKKEYSKFEWMNE
jgi:hypothetical protein